MQDVIGYKNYVFYVLFQTGKNKMIKEFMAQSEILIILICDDSQIVLNLVLDIFSAR